MLALPIAIINKLGKPVIAIILTICAILVTLSVLGVISSGNQIEQIADELILDETGFDLEKSEENLFKK